MDKEILELIVNRLREQANDVLLRITAHAHQEMTEEDVVLDDVIDVLRAATVVENYPEHKRGACCLVAGRTRRNRVLHVVCSTSLDFAVVITVYEPKPARWVTPYERRES